MLRALCEYYDCLRARNDEALVPAGYSRVNVSWNLVLRPDGGIKDILPYVEEKVIGKKIGTVGREEIFPFRNSIPGIAAETVDHREKYLFGLVWDKESQSLRAEPKALEAFEKNKEVNLSFLEDIRAPLAQAYVAFLQTWVPQEHTEEPALQKLGKDFAAAKFVITLEGEEALPLNALPEVKAKWEEGLRAPAVGAETVVGQCAVCGRVLPLARLHDNIMGIPGGQSTGMNLVSFNNTGFESYGREQSYNSSISVEAMKKYTGALNYLISSGVHRQKLGDMTLLFWANTKDREDPYVDTFLQGLFPASGEEDETIKKVFESMVQGLEADLAGVDFSTPFYILGIKPNASRLSVKLFERNTFGNLMRNVARHCRDLRFSPEDRQLALWEIDRALQSPNVTESGDPALQAKLLTAVIRGTPYPQTLFNTLVRRCRTDHDDPGKKFYSISTTRARILRACLRRKNIFQEEEYLMLQENSPDTAYQLGRLFAVLEKIQGEALGDLNATIKDKYFSSACTTPALVFPRLLRLAQPHLAKLEDGNRIFKEKMLQQILGSLDEGFPRSLSIERQGMFILGYYQQRQKFYEKKEKGE